MSISSITKLESESESLVTGFSTTRSTVFLTVLSTVCVTLLVTVLTPLAVLTLDEVLFVVLAEVCGLVFRLADFESGGLVDFEGVLVVVVVGSLNPVYSSHFGPITSLMPPQISSLFVVDVDLMEIAVEDDGSDFVAFVCFQISNSPLVELFLAELDCETDPPVVFIPLQNRNPPTAEPALTEAVVEVVVDGVVLTTTFSKRSLLCSCLLSEYGISKSRQK
jgi:hypothetical protein